ncbi:type VII secretion integral membrane protein EccD [Mycobacterium sp. B14F4]|uniref:type VII secretion integral membrane protein EccD n=1 Tax=Mycobacterium sp. B14F4 TaxID=3153565 RepID=UPI00325F4053
MAVHHDGRTVDLALPSTVDLAQLLPSIVDIVRDDHDAVEGRWRLHRIGDRPLDESLTLRQNVVHDGELLWLTTDDPPTFRWTERDPCHVVAKAAADRDPAPAVFVAAGMITASVGAAALLWSARATGDARWLVGATLSAAGLVAAVAARRTPHALPIVSACGLIAVLFAAVSGAIAVPAGPVAAHLLLASAAACAVSALLLRLTSCGATTLTALVPLTLLVATASMAGVMWSLRPAAVGASLATLSLAAVGAAPRMAIAIARVGPTADDASAPDVDERRAALAHTTLTGMVSGSAIAAAVGAVLVAYGQATGRSSPLPAVAFTALVGVALTLRARTHPDPVRRGVLIVSGSLGVATAFAVGAMSAPQAAHWFSIPAVAAAAGTLTPLLGLTFGPVAHRMADVTEYVTLAVTVPLACWVGGVYGLVRDAALL